MKDQELLLHINEDWMTINALKEKLNLNWEKLFAQLKGMESKRLIEIIEIKRRRNVYRHVRKPMKDEHKISIIKRTPFRDRSNIDHQYIVQYEYSNNLRTYINDIIKEVENESNK